MNFYLFLFIFSVGLALLGSKLSFWVCIMVSDVELLFLKIKSSGLKIIEMHKNITEKYYNIT